jgi:hypothetical protein
MTHKRLIAAIFVLVAWGAATPNVTVAQDQLQTRDRLLMQTPGACLPAPIKDQLKTQDRTKLVTPTTTAVTTAAPQVVSPSGTLLKKRDQIRLNTTPGVCPR